MALPPECQLDRLADLVPPPRKHRHRYHGVFAPNHKLRRAVTALAIGNVGKRREVRQTIELTFRRQGHPWPLPPWAVAAKAEVWLDRRTGILPADGESSKTPPAPGRVDVRPRPGPSQLAALCRGST